MLFGNAQSTINTAIASAAYEVRAAATSNPKIIELGFSQITAPGAVSTYGLGRPSAIGVNPTTLATFTSEVSVSNLIANPTTSAAIAWGTGPAVPANFNRRASATTAIGVGAVWTFPRGLDLAPASSIVLWLITAAVTLNVWCAIDE